MSRVFAILGRAVVIFVALAAIVSQVAGRMDADAYSSWTSRAIVLLIVCATAVLCRGFRRPDVPMAWAIPVVGAAILIGLIVALGETGRGNGWLLAGDHLRHLVLIADEWERGHLDYGAVSYPRGWHAAMALVWGATGGAELTPDGLMVLLTVAGLGVWLLAVALAATSGVLAIASLRRIGTVGRSALGLAGLVGSALVWLSPLMGPTLALGFQTTLVATLAVVVALQELGQRETVRSACVVAAAVVVVAHTWQLLLPALVVPVLCVWTVAWRSGNRQGRILLTTTAVTAAVGSIAPLVAVVAEIGLDAAALQGDNRPLPTLVIATTGCLAAVFAVVAWRGRAAPEPVALLTVCAVLVAWGFLLAAIVGVSPASYYPSKVHWAAVMVVLPVASAGVVAGLAWLDQKSGGWRAVFVPASAVAALVTMIGIAGPWLAFSGRWSTADGVRVVAIATSPQASDARAVWTTGPSVDDRTARALLDVYHVDMVDGIPPFIRASVDRDCAALIASSPPTVLTDRLPAEVRDRYSCVPSLVIAPIQTRR